MSAKLREALSADVVEGLNVRVTVQLPPATTGDPVAQVIEVMGKSALFGPVRLGLLVKLSDPLPVFISVTVIAPLVVPWGTEPNGSLPGSVTMGAVPVPVSETV